MEINIKCLLMFFCQTQILNSQDFCFFFWKSIICLCGGADPKWKTDIKTYTDGCNKNSVKTENRRVY